MIVAKFGGTSLASASQIKKVCDIVTFDPERRIVVVSAPGKRDREDVKVTDMLIACANASLEKRNAADEFNAVVARYAEIASGLGLSGDIVNTIADDIRERLNSDISNQGKYIDNLKAAGEDNIAKLVAAYLRSIGYDARYVSPKDAGLILSDEFGMQQCCPSHTKT